MTNLSAHKNLFDSYLEENSNYVDPKNLYDPVNYIMSIGGKRIRPCLALLSCDLYGTNPKKALDAALTVEMFHNFSLIHDDIMDRADLRRGKLTVHKKWDLNTGILSGDVLMILAYKQLESYSDDLFKGLMQLFTQTSIEVCEGQQMDIDFESRIDVSAEEYYKMIMFKTAVLLGCSLKMGTMVAQAPLSDQAEIYDFGLNLGLAFQLQDDYLDTFGGQDFGKRIGGDILERKKTILYIHTLNLADEKDQGRLIELYGGAEQQETSDSQEKELIDEVRNLFLKYRVDQLLLQEIRNYTDKALENITQLNLNEDGKEQLRQFSMTLMNRKT